MLPAAAAATVIVLGTAGSAGGVHARASGPPPDQRVHDEPRPDRRVLFAMGHIA